MNNKLIKISGVIILVFFIPAVIIVFFPDLWTALYAKTRFSIVLAPQLYRVPAQKEITPLADNIKRPFGYKNVSFATPWKDESKTKNEGETLKVNALSGKSLFISEGADIFMTFLAKIPLGKNIQKLYHENFTNDFEYYKTILSATPETITFSTSHQDIQTNLNLLQLKSQLIDGAKGEYIFFHTKFAKGLWFSPVKSPDATIIELFTQDNAHHTITTKKISQEEIIFFLSSIKSS